MIKGKFSRLFFFFLLIPIGNSAFETIRLTNLKVLPNMRLLFQILDFRYKNLLEGDIAVLYTYYIIWYLTFHNHTFLLT